MDERRAAVRSLPGLTLGGGLRYPFSARGRWSSVDLVDGPAILTQNPRRAAPLPPLPCRLGRLHRPTHPPTSCPADAGVGPDERVVVATVVGSQ
jgi:hypothetical protein